MRIMDKKEMWGVHPSYFSFSKSAKERNHLKVGVFEVNNNLYKKLDTMEIYEDDLSFQSQTHQSEKEFVIKKGVCINSKGN